MVNGRCFYVVSNRVRCEIGVLEKKHCDFKIGGIHSRQSLTIENGGYALHKVINLKH